MVESRKFFHEKLMSMLQARTLDFSKHIRRVCCVLAMQALLLACQTPAPLDPGACKTIVVLPPESIDERTSDYVIRRWFQAARRQKLLRPCDKVVEKGLAKNHFRFLNISHTAPVEASRLNARQRTVFQKNLKATHAVSLSYSYSFRYLEIKPLLYEIVSYRKEETPLARTVKLQEVEGDYFNISFERWTKLSLLRLIPTSLVGGFSSSEFINEYAESGESQLYHEVSRERASEFPPILSSFRFENTLHRSGFNLFDFSLRFAPYFNFHFVNNRYIYAPIDEYRAYEENPNLSYSTFDYKLKFYASTLNILGDLSLYSPIGTFFFSLGPGLSLYHYQDNQSEQATGFTPTGLIRFGYRAFITQRWFFQVLLESQFFTNDVDSEYFKSESDSYGIVGVGFFYPEIQRAASQRLLD